MTFEKNNATSSPKPVATTPKSISSKTTVSGAAAPKEQAKPPTIKVQAPTAKNSELLRANLPADTLGRSQVQSQASGKVDSARANPNQPPNLNVSHSNAGGVSATPANAGGVSATPAKTTEPEASSTSEVSAVTGTAPGKPASFKPGNILIFDGFTDQSNFIDFNSDNIGDISHGHLVRTLLEAQGVPPNKITIVNKGPNGEVIDTVGSQLRQLSTNIKENNGKLTSGLDGKPIEPVQISAVNFSQSTFTTIDDVQQTLGMNGLTPENLSENREAIRKSLATFAQANPQHQYASYQAGVEAIDTLSSLGIRVYVAGGNQGHNDFNLFSLGNEAISVGATQPLTSSPETENTTQNTPQASSKISVGQTKWTDSPTWGTADNSLIARYEQGFFPIQEIKTSGPQPLGFDFTGDAKVDIPFNKVFDPDLHGKLLEHFGLPAEYKPPINRAFRGTSFAVPTALGEDWTQFFNIQPTH